MRMKAHKTFFEALLVLQWQSFKDWEKDDIHLSTKIKNFEESLTKLSPVSCFEDEENGDNKSIYRNIMVRVIFISKLSHRI